MTLAKMRELFASDQFDIQSFLDSHKSTDSKELVNQIAACNKNVQDDLFDLINGDLEHFKEIIKKASETDIEAIKSGRAELEQIKSQKETNYLKFKEFYEELEKKKTRLEYIRRKKELMIRLQKTSKYIETYNLRRNDVEKSLYELELGVNRYLWAHQFATNYNQELADSDIHRDLSGYSEGLQESVEIHLKRIMEKQPFDKGDVEIILCLCKRINWLNLFEASFKFVLLYPAMEGFLQSSINFKGAPLNFQGFVQKSLEFLNSLKEVWDPFISQYYEECSKFWTRTVLAPVLAFIVERCSSVFNPIDLIEFKTNFQAGLKFVSDIEARFFENEEDLLFFRSQTSWINFMKKWALHQYFQIRVKQIFAPIENILRYEIDLDAEPKIFDATLVTINALKHLWSDEVILRPLIPKFLKISLQLIRRFIDYCIEDAKGHKDAKVFLRTVIHKRYNLEKFVPLIEENSRDSMVSILDELEDNLFQNILEISKNEQNSALQKIDLTLIQGIEALYNQQLCKEEWRGLNLESLIELQESQYLSINYDLKDTIQQILLKFNRTIFKLIDEKRLKAAEYPEVLARIKIIEGQVRKLELSSLLEEEFWLEIKAAVSQSH